MTIFNIKFVYVDLVSPDVMLKDKVILMPQKIATITINEPVML